METEPGYKLVIQVLYYASSHSFYGFLHVFDGANISVSSPWKMESLPWKDRPILNSTKSSVVFDFYNRYMYHRNLAINFLVYTVKGYYREMSLSLFVTGSTFAWNKKGAVFCFRTHGRTVPVTLQFESNIFFRNQGTTVEIMAETERTTWVFLNNTFNENRGDSVIALRTASLSGAYYKPTLVVSGNKFLANYCPDKAVIATDIQKEANTFIINDNDFEFNSGSCVLLDGTAAYGTISMADNVFNENDCGKKSVIDGLCLGQDTKFTNNTFTQNRAGTVVLLQVVQDIRSSSQNKEFTFYNNTLSKNIPHNSSYSPSAGDSCVVVLSGVLYHKEAELRLNKFNNSKYLKELCVLVPAISARDIVNAKHNWWGTAIGSEVRDRISDSDDNYDFAIADEWPFLLSDDGPTLTAVEQYDFKQQGSVLSGRLFESITLKTSHSPYSVTSDLTVLENVRLTIEAGVTVKDKPWNEHTCCWSAPSSRNVYQTSYIRSQGTYR
ncbi:hypothetical protein ACROYT_G034387 [Oculina patagonica]